MEKRRMAGLTRRDGMRYKNYQPKSFWALKFNNVLSTFFADEYVNRYVVTTIFYVFLY